MTVSCVSKAATISKDNRAAQERYRRERHPVFQRNRPNWLAAEAGIKLNPSTLLVFGNPPLGTQFMTAKPNAGPGLAVRLLVIQDSAGAVWTVYTDFAWIATRHGIVNRTEQFKMASMVIASNLEREGLRREVIGLRRFAAEPILEQRYRIAVGYRD